MRREESGVVGHDGAMGERGKMRRERERANRTVRRNQSSRETTTPPLFAHPTSRALLTRQAPLIFDEECGSWC